MYFLRFLMQARGTLSRYVPETLSTGGVSAARLPISSNNVEEAAAVQRKLHIIIGNESCDLDSAVSALTLAFIYAMRYNQHDYVPVLNIPRTDYPLKTEVGFMFQKYGIAEQMLLFRDDLPSTLASDFNVILVDHHVSGFARNVVEILDHRPLDDNPALKLLPASCKRQIEPEVGSCATLIGEQYYAEEEPRSNNVAQLLHATIVLDTINFSPTAKRFGPRDVDVVKQLEQSLYGEADIDIESVRRTIFDELVAARADISTLTLTEVLRKDMKLLQTERHLVPMAGLPMLVRHFIERCDAAEAVREFGAGSKLLIMLGMFVSPVDGQVQRDVGIISLTGQTHLVERVKQALLLAQSPNFQLLPHEQQDIQFLGGCFLRQLNVQATRKHILPVIKKSLLDWEATQGDCEDVYFFKEKPKLSLS